MQEVVMASSLKYFRSNRSPSEPVWILSNCKCRLSADCHYHYTQSLPIFLHFHCVVSRQNRKHIFQVTTVTSFVYATTQSMRIALTAFAWNFYWFVCKCLRHDQ
jgi:hypothetical protein